MTAAAAAVAVAVISGGGGGGRGGGGGYTVPPGGCALPPNGSYGGSGSGGGDPVGHRTRGRDPRLRASSLMCGGRCRTNLRRVDTWKSCSAAAVSGYYSSMLNWV